MPGSLAWSLWLLPSFALGQTQLPTASRYSSNADGLSTAAGTATATIGTVRISGTDSTCRVIETLPASIDETPPVLPNIQDPQAVNAQDVCPG